MGPAAFIFDVFGTIVDWREGIARETASIFTSKKIDYDPHQFADQWRSKYDPAMQRIRSGNRGYVSLDILHRENLDELLIDTQLSGQFSEAERVNFNRAWEKLPPWPDSVDGLTTLKRNAIIAPCSNGSISLMTRLAKYGSLPWDCILGAEIAQNYKPSPETYLKSVAALGLKPAEVMMVAAHNSDLESARSCGLKTAFIARPSEHGPHQTIDLKPTSDWDFVVNTLDELQHQITSSQKSIMKK